MRHPSCLAVLVIAAVPIMLFSAPVPLRKNAKPAVLSAGSEIWIRDIKETIPLTARYAIVHDEKAHKIAILRKHLTAWKSAPQKEWDAFDKWLKKNFLVERVKGKNLVRISFKDGNRDEQAAIINVVVDYYLKKDIEDRRNELNRLIRLTRGLKERNRRDPRKTKEDLADSDKEIKKLEDRIGDLPKLVERAKAR